MIDEQRPSCKLCGSDNVYLYGYYKRERRYLCKCCRRKFKADDALPNMRVSKYIVGLSISLSKKLSLRKIREVIFKEYGFRPSLNTLWKWTKRAELDCMIAPVGYQYRYHSYFQDHPENDGLVIPTNCQYHPDCFSCPEDDCIYEPTTSKQNQKYGACLPPEASA